MSLTVAVAVELVSACVCVDVELEFVAVVEVAAWWCTSSSWLLLLLVVLGDLLNNFFDTGIGLGDGSILGLNWKLTLFPLLFPLVLLLAVELPPLPKLRRFFGYIIQCHHTHTYIHHTYNVMHHASYIIHHTMSYIHHTYIHHTYRIIRHSSSCLTFFLAFFGFRFRFRFGGGLLLRVRVAVGTGAVRAFNVSLQMIISAEALVTQRAWKGSIVHVCSEVTCETVMCDRHVQNNNSKQHK